MTDPFREGDPPPQQRPTNVRNVILWMAVAVAVLLYVDRYCLSASISNIETSLGLTANQRALVVSIFFLPYALGQIPFGYLADRYGARRMLTAYMAIWSVLTALLGLAVGFFDLIIYRLGCGLFESGAYPACAGIIKRWIPLEKRGIASGIVSLGGRLGGAVTPKLTTVLMAGFASVGLVSEPESWRPVFILYGIGGIVLAAIFYYVQRDTPAQHPGVNAAELALITADTAAATPTAIAPGTSPTPRPAPGMWWAILSNRMLWLSSFIQFGINFGWAFLLTTFTVYLLEVHFADLQSRGTMNTIVVSMSLPSLIFGGWMTDALTKRYGKRWGRALPMAIPRLISAALYFVVAMLSIAWQPPPPPPQLVGEIASLVQPQSGPWEQVAAVPNVDAVAQHVVDVMRPEAYRTWTIVLLLGLVAFFSDLSIPSLWAFSLDIGGKNVGFVLGWTNMWGNLGAFASPLVLTAVVNHYGWIGVFWTCGGVFAIIGVASLFMDSRESLPD